eukprot:CAMPEP_0194531178 /NCGR_PEP_ID=MMETSP0253-20130528/68425_1 /TAXON_ID=2966 /ORGANISM="Noctiluca scintillans" /LENGTH=113 /DNA_ID=CAMNT_0039376505 /DNA_START=163 /DNA_END=504 /DNA_ORIENTATION=-
MPLPPPAPCASHVPAERGVAALLPQSAADVPEVSDASSAQLVAQCGRPLPIWRETPVATVRLLPDQSAVFAVTHGHFPDTHELRSRAHGSYVATPSPSPLATAVPVPPVGEMP